MLMAFRNPKRMISEQIESYSGSYVTVVLLALLLLFLSTLAAHADQGSLEINPLCVASGCFAGDAPGFPVEINASGSYRLTGALDVSGQPDPENVTAISISAPLVTVDMNGFAITGPVTCSPVNGCIPAGGTGVGIATLTSGRVIIRNGSIQGMGDDAINCLSQCELADLYVTQNGGDGVNASSLNNNAVRINALHNAGNGITFRGLVEKSHAVGNGEIGIVMAADSQLRNSTASSNDDSGILCIRCSLMDNISSFNSGFGVEYSGASIAGGNRLFSNSAGSFSGTAPLQSAPNWCGNSAC